ncbi:hypothetical protein TVAGG3_0541930 [Trichomonas vaginalis G3]|nr:hypothetical protein TVAGG3_0541930 [Trichomonas vaginalis G3]KAI5519895.1 hypothetical protein TVAGG3_0541930 [Trichomonas vaginalis G3]
MAARNKRSLGIDYSVLDTESGKLRYSPVSLEASSSILQLAFDNPNLKFKGLASSPDFVPILHYCAISVRRFVSNVERDIKSLIKNAQKSQTPSLAEELFIIEIFIIHGIEFTEEAFPQILELYPNFEKDLAICLQKTENLGYLKDSILKKKDEEFELSDEALLEIYNKSEIEFWCIIVEYERYNIIVSLIQEIRTNKRFDFPTEFLLANFRGSPKSMNVIKEYIKSNFENFFDDERWIRSFVQETTEILDFLILDMGINSKKLSKISTLYVPLLKEFFYLVQFGKADYKQLISFITMVKDEDFHTILEKQPIIANEFRSFFLTYIDLLFNNQKWTKYVEQSSVLLSYIGINLYTSIPSQIKNQLPGLTILIIANFIVNNNIEQMVNIIVTNSTSFLVDVLQSDKDHEIRFQNIFIPNFDSFIVDKRFRDYILSSDLLLNIIVTDVIPKSDTKQREICQDLYEEYLTRVLNSTHNIVLSDFVTLITSAQAKQFLNFDVLRPSLQVAIFQSVARKLTPAELSANKKVYTSFFSSFLKNHTLLLLIPEELRRPFFMTVVLPYITANTIGLTVMQMYDLVISIVDDPFADQERPDFFFFIVEHAEELLPSIKQNPKLMETLWDFLTNTQLDLRANDSKNFIFNICVIKLRTEIPDNARLYQMTTANFSPEVFEKLDQTAKTEIIFKISEAFNRPLEPLFAEPTQKQLYTDSAQSCLDLLAQDKEFVPTISLVLKRENKEFIRLLINVFSKERPFLELFSRPEIFMNFMTISLDLFQVLVKGLVLTNDRFEHFFLFLQRYAMDISYNDTLRHALLLYFITNDAKLGKFIPFVTSPTFRAFFFTDFTDPARNSVLGQVFNTYLDKARSFETPMSAIFNVFVTISNLSFINVKNHECVVNDSVNYFNFNKNEYEFDAMFPKQRQIEIENALYALIVNVGPVKFIEFLKAFDGLHPGPNNCFKEATENALLLYNDMYEEEPDESVVEYERKHPRFRRFVQKPDRFNEFVHGILAVSLMIYLGILSWSTSQGKTVSCAVIGSIAAFMVAFTPLYFPVLEKPGYTPWFWISIVLVIVNFAFSFATFAMTKTYDYNVPLVILIVLFAIVSLHRVIHKLQGIPEEEYDEGDLLIIN